MIGLGVGITPVRALLLSLNNQTSRDVNLVYSSVSNYMFKETIDKIVSKNQHIMVDYVTTPKDTEEKYLDLAKKYKNDAYYFISGNYKVIGIIKKVLRKNGIKKSRIINDPFLGY